MVDGDHLVDPSFNTCARPRVSNEAHLVYA
jgi:hypothetical protein